MRFLVPFKCLPSDHSSQEARRKLEEEQKEVTDEEDIEEEEEEKENEDQKHIAVENMFFDVCKNENEVKKINPV